MYIDFLFLFHFRYFACLFGVNDDLNKKFFFSFFRLFDSSIDSHFPHFDLFFFGFWNFEKTTSTD